MKVQIEKFDEPGGILRVWYDDKSQPGRDPYQLALTARWVNDEAIELKGLRREKDEGGPFAIPAQAWREIFAEAARMGIKYIVRVRMNTGVRRERWISTKRGNK